MQSFKFYRYVFCVIFKNSLVTFPERTVFNYFSVSYDNSLPGGEPVPLVAIHHLYDRTVVHQQVRLQIFAGAVGRNVHKEHMYFKSCVCWLTYTCMSTVCICIRTQIVRGSGEEGALDCRDQRKPLTMYTYRIRLVTGGRNIKHKLL